MKVPYLAASPDLAIQDVLYRVHRGYFMTGVLP